MEPRTLEGGVGGWWDLAEFGGLGAAQSPVFIVTLQSPLCISPLRQALGNDTFVTALHHTPCPKGSCCPTMKGGSFMVNFTISVKHGSTPAINKKVPCPMVSRTAPSVSGLCHGVPAHKEDMSACGSVTATNLWFRSIYGAPVMLRSWEGASHSLQTACALKRGMTSHDTLHTNWR